MMYISLGLPQIIKDVTLGLPEDIMHDCLSHILLTGGNTDLSGFALRLKRDLRELLPEYDPILEVRSCPGTHSWNVAMGSTYVPLVVHPGKLTIQLLNLLEKNFYLFSISNKIIIYFFNICVC